MPSNLYLPQRGTEMITFRIFALMSFTNEKEATVR